MAVNPLEGLRKVAAKHQLDFSFVEEPQLQQASAASSPASVHRQRQSPRCSWPQPGRMQVQSKCGSRTDSGSSCCPAIHSRMLKGHSPQNAARERNRVRSLREAFYNLQDGFPSVPPDTKLSKLDVLVLATNYIAYLTKTLDDGGILTENSLPPRSGGYLHPVKKWPMRSLLYCGSIGELLSELPAKQASPPGHEETLNPASEDTDS
ncbi:transcription factor 24 [Cynoglossus semilaevis]|uniref:transcription factor 24 n=1 Tax=Cynoglossus semilaevis TaxID=244447 RepID=UPI0004962613|nr:transcription factor 23 [Cynoglossus semilaevis]